MKREEMTDLQRIASIRAEMEYRSNPIRMDVLWLCDHAERAILAQDHLCEYAHIEGKHHLRWLIDTLARDLSTEEEYEQLFASDPDWRKGIAP